MSGQWKPGDVALVSNANGDETNACIGLYQYGDRWVCPHGDIVADLATTRPLVVIDPEDRRSIEALRDIYDQQVIVQNDDPDPRDVSPAARANALVAALRELAASTPPKPDEPQGLGAVVEDAEGQRWVRSHNHNPSAPWTRPYLSGAYRYDTIAAVRVLSEGVTP